MLIKCPCDKEIIAKNSLGLIIYYHVADDTSCHYLNRLDMPVEKISVVMFKSVGFLPENKVTAATMLVSKEARLQAYDFLSRASSDDLFNNIIAFKKIIDSYHPTHANEIIKEACEVIGEPLVFNIKIATGVDYGAHLLRSDKTPKFTMNRIDQETIRRRLGKISTPDSRHNQTLSDIIDGI
ncbi:MAG TPA: hypothetical protein VL443_08105 [Cyclobacteriaceae bacterium]|nr:hypothetical protein [Cyclobacteriaceae bacterium]